MPSLVEDVEQRDKARFNLKANRVVAEIGENGSLVFVVPKSLEERLKKEYNFSVEMLSVGGDIPLADLAVHLDEQSSMEAHAGMIAEFLRYQLKQKQDEYELWYEKVFYKTKKLMQSAGDKNITDKGVSSKISALHGKEIARYRKKINGLELQYRLANNVIRASLITKGTLLPTLRNIVQGKEGQGLGRIDKSERVRNRLKFKKENRKCQR